MMRLLRCILLLLLLGQQVAHAAYTNAVPPVGTQAVGSQWYAAANGGSWLNGATARSATINVGGRIITAPARMRMAANAGRYIIQAATLHPLVRTAAVLSWLAVGGFSWDDVLGWRRTQGPYLWVVYTSGTWTGEVPMEGCLDGLQLALPSTQYAEFLSLTFSTETNAQCRRVIKRVSDDAILDDNNYYRGMERQANPNAGTPVAVPSTDVQDWGDANPPPDSVPNSIPLMPPVSDPGPGEPALPGHVPIESPPIINPSEDPIPVPVPWQIPSGDPYLVPGSSPEVWRQPTIQIRPSPTDAEPWRVDVRPGSVDSPTNSPIPDEGEAIPETGGGPVPDPQQQLCDAFPDIAACAPLGMPEDTAVAPPTEDRSFEIPTGPTFGPENAACPADRAMVTGLVGTLYFSWEGACMFADGVRPVVVGLAMLASILMFFGIGKRSD